MSGLGKAACVMVRLVVLFNRYVFVATVRSPILPDWNAASSRQELAALFHRWLPLQARHRIASAQRRRCQNVTNQVADHGAEPPPPRPSQPSDLHFPP
jgi:hypothetical protein